MALFRRNALLLSALLLIGVPGLVRTENDIEDGVTIETVEEDAEEYHSPQVDSKKVFLAEHFDDQKAFDKKWIRSEAKKQGVDENIAKYDGKWELQTPSRKILRDDMGLVLTTEAKHAAISTLLDRPFEFKDKPFIVQYEVTMQEGQNCGGAYLKLLSKGTSTKADLRKFHDQTAYSIMFGPDKCGNDNKLHFIFRHRNPKNGSFEEKHSKKPTQRLDEIYKDKEPHLYTLIVRPDNSFTILVDNKEVNSGSLLEDFTPAVNPPEEIDDPNDKKPADWDDREMIVDPSATKPDDWDEEAPAQIVDPNAAKPSGWLDDEPLMISDPEAKKPEDWDDDMDGEWEAPLIDNPACESAPGCGEWKPPLIANPEYKGIWRAPLINNPQYSGKWSPRRIPNPDFFKDEHPFRMTPIHAVGFELWSMSPMLLFDNLIITDDPAVAEMWALQGFALKRAKLSRDSDSVIDRALQYASDNPWVYAVAVLGTVLVVGFVLYLCSGSSKSDVEEINDPKKTDAFVEDDEHHSEGDEAAEDEQEDESEAERPRNKADLEGPAAQDSEKQKLDKTLQTEKEAAAKKLKDDQEETPLVDTEGAGDAQRKRKPRKE